VMFFNSQIKGDGLPEKALCLTFDDGPGPHTLDLARYLSRQGISATFFMIGASAAAQFEVVEEVRRLGHFVGNHTWSHPDLASLAAEEGDVVGEIERTDIVLRSRLSDEVLFFRPPYGSWKEKTESGQAEGSLRSLVAERLGQISHLSHYLGPIHWDISACDYDFWKKHEPALACAEFCLSEIDRVGRGIVLMHDSSEDAALRRWNRTHEVVEIIIPALKKRGFGFVGLDAVPAVQVAVGTPRV
jgi:peptidoglycan-N-acetylglucosamine deacetylase